MMLQTRRYMYLLTTSLRQLRLFSITTFDEKEVPPSTKHREARRPIRASPALIVVATFTIFVLMQRLVCNIAYFGY